MAEALPSARPGTGETDFDLDVAAATRQIFSACVHVHSIHVQMGIIGRRGNLGA
jgi:hypothetical protein